MIVIAAPLSKVLVFLINVTGITLVVNVFLSEAKRIIKYIFSAMTLLMFIWVDLAFLARIVAESDIHTSILFIRIAWSVTPMLFVLVYYFLVNYLRFHKEKHILTSLLFGLGVFFFIITLFSDTVIASTEVIDGVLNINYGLFVWGFFGIIAILTIINFIVLVKAYLKADVEMKKRIRLLLIGLTIFFVLNAIFNIFYPFFLRVFHLYEFGDYSLIVFMTIIAYALIRHRMFGIKVILSLFTVVFIGVFLTMDAIFFSPGWIERLSKFVIVAIYVPVGYLLVKSVIREIEQKEQLAELNNKLKNMDLKKNEFINMAAHELRAPLTAIKGFVSMILEGDTGDVSDKTKEFLEDSKLSTDRMIRLVNNMLDVSRIEEGRITFQDNVIDITEVIDLAFNEFKLEARRKGLNYTLDVQSNLEAKVHVDRDRLHEVVVNMLSNAIKYTDKGFVEIKVYNPESGKLRVEVKDSGMGISKPEQKKLFNKFYRVESSAGKTIGTGLGLYISKLLIEHFKGTIGVESEFGKGSTFWFELPIVKNKKDV